MEILDSNILSLRDILHVVFKHKKQILFLFLVTVIAVAVGTIAAKPTYEAEAKILVKIGRENLYAPPNSATSQIIKPNREDQINSELELLKSRSLAESVVKFLGAGTLYKNLDDTDVVKNFQKSFSAEGVEKSNIISIRFKHENPKLAATIVNTLVDAYLEKHLLIHKNSQSYNFFEEQSKILRSKLEQAEEALRKFKKQHGVTDIGEEQKLLLKQIGDLRIELNRTSSQEAETKNRILQISAQLAKTPETITQGKVVDYNSGLISNLEARLVELQLKEEDLLIKYTPQSRLVKNIEEEIQIVREKLVEQENKQYGKSSIGLNPTYQRLKEELFRNQAEHKALAAKKEIQNVQIADYQSKLEKLNQIEMKINQLQQMVDVNRQSYRFYMNKFEESRISDAMDNKKITNVSLIEAASPPLYPVSPKVLLNIFIGILLGGFGGIGLGFFTEFMDDSLEKPEDVEKVLQLPVLASIPEIEN
jgi:polysaccharide chain length determinant protein (PEP-CTERM system associated)